MNKKSRISLIVLLTVILLMALTIPVQARNQPYGVCIAYTLDKVNWNKYHAKGEFEVVEPVTLEREGTVILDWTAKNQVKQGTMSLTSLYDGEEKTLVIGFSIPVKPAEETCGTGSFRVLPELSVGYDLRATGTIEMCRVGDGPTATIEGHLWGSLLPD